MLKVCLLCVKFR